MLIGAVTTKKKIKKYQDSLESKPLETTLFLLQRGWVLHALGGGSVFSQREWLLYVFGGHSILLTEKLIVDMFFSLWSYVYTFQYATEHVLKLNS